MKKFFALIICFVVVLANFGCKKDKKSYLDTQNLTGYCIDVDFDNETKSADCSMRVDFYNNTDTVLDELLFHIYPNFFSEGMTEYVIPNNKMNQAYPKGKSYSEFSMNRILVEQKDVDINYKDEKQTLLEVDLFKNLLPGDRAFLDFEFSFKLPNCQHRFGYGDNTINLANFYPILCVFENGEFDENGYNANGDPFYSEISNYQVNITLDKNLVVAGSGEKITKEKEEDKTCSFTAEAIRDFALVISEKFNVIKNETNGVEIEYYYFDDEFPEESLKTGMDALKTFSNLFGKYPYKNYRIVESDFVFGGMEYPNLVMISKDIENHDDYKNVIIHETAHQWWYSVVGNNEYEEPWVDEALTEFSTMLFYDYNKDYTFTRKEMIKASYENYRLFVSVYQDVLGQLDTSMRSVDKYNTEPEYTYCIYVKGALMYESLYELIGEKDFIKALKIYYEKNKFKNVRTIDIINSFEKASKQDLTNFFESWLKGKVVIK